MIYHIEIVNSDEINTKRNKYILKLCECNFSIIRNRTCETISGYFNLKISVDPKDYMKLRYRMENVHNIWKKRVKCIEKYRRNLQTEIVNFLFENLFLLEFLYLFKKCYTLNWGNRELNFNVFQFVHVSIVYFRNR